MAKTGSMLKAIKAKPNERGKRSHLPIKCSIKDCEEDFFLSKPSFVAKRFCNEHAPLAFKPTTVSDQEILQALGLV